MCAQWVGSRALQKLQIIIYYYYYYYYAPVQSVCEQSLKAELSEKLKRGINVIVGNAVLELLIKTIFCTFDKMTQNLLGVLKYAIFSFSDNLFQDAYKNVLFNNSVDNFYKAYKTCLILVYVTLLP